MNAVNFFKITNGLIFLCILNIVNANEFYGSVNLKNVELTKTIVNGMASLKDSKFQELTVNGSLNFQNLRISGTVEVNGSMHGKSLKCDNLTVFGSLRAQNITINQKTIISGSLKLQNSCLKELQVSSRKIIIENSTAKNILIKNSKDQYKQQLILKGEKTKINGDIVFESGLGEIFIDSKAKITGKVHGGKIIYDKN